MTKERTSAELWKNLAREIDKLLEIVTTLKMEVEEVVGESANEISDNALLFFPAPPIASNRDLFTGSKN